MVHRRGTWTGRPLSPSLPVTARLITPVGVAVATTLRLPRRCAVATPRQLTACPALNHLHQMVRCLPYIIQPYESVQEGGGGQLGEIVNVSMQNRTALDCLVIGTYNLYRMWYQNEVIAHAHCKAIALPRLWPQLVLYCSLIIVFPQFHSTYLLNTH